MSARGRRGAAIRSAAAIAAAIAAYALVLWVVMTTRAHAHDAPTGWTYPTDCCSGFDCREVGDARTPDAAIRVLERPEGYVISSTGEVVPHGHRRLRHSPDGRFHWCSHGGRDDAGTICLFVPPRSF